jgi:hypothetical protein
MEIHRFWEQPHIFFLENESKLLEICTAGYHPLVGNGFCGDATNIAECNFDGGDCCVNVNTDYCSDCNCLGGGVITKPLGWDDNLDLTWLIHVQLGQSIEINFLSFYVSWPAANCR